jgi:hypothetical protein
VVLLCALGWVGWHVLSQPAEAMDCSPAALAVGAR